MDLIFPDKAGLVVFALVGLIVRFAEQVAAVLVGLWIWNRMSHRAG